MKLWTTRGISIVVLAVVCGVVVGLSVEYLLDQLQGETSRRSVLNRLVPLTINVLIAVLVVRYLAPRFLKPKTRPNHPESRENHRKPEGTSPAQDETGSTELAHTDIDATIV